MYLAYDRCAGFPMSRYSHAVNTVFACVAVSSMGIVNHASACVKTCFSCWYVRVWDEDQDDGDAGPEADAC